MTETTNDINPPVDLMIDIETLDTLPTAQIVEIGVCEIPKIQFNDDTDPWSLKYMQSLRKAAIPINPTMQSRYGLTKGESTIRWWLGDVERAKQLDRYYSVGILLEDALEQLAVIIERAQPRHVWCKGSSFDFAILRNAYAALSMPVPWEYRNEKDLRTFSIIQERSKYEAHRAKIISKFDLSLHNAQDDAILQAYQVADMYDELGFLLGAAENTFGDDLQSLEEDIKDAERYRWLRNDNAYYPEEAGIMGGKDLDDAIDAALLENTGRSNND